MKNEIGTRDALHIAFHTHICVELNKTCMHPPFAQLLASEGRIVKPSLWHVHLRRQPTAVAKYCRWLALVAFEYFMIISQPFRTGTLECSRVPTGGLSPFRDPLLR